MTIFGGKAAARTAHVGPLTDFENGYIQGVKDAAQRLPLIPGTTYTVRTTFTAERAAAMTRQLVGSNLNVRLIFVGNEITAIQPGG